MSPIPLPYVPYDELNGRPNIIVDGAAADGTVLTLSHWPGSATPEELAADVSAEIAFNYLEAEDRHVAAEAVSNNHYDADGVISCAVLSDPKSMSKRRDFWIDVATAGDFERFKNPDAARMSFAISAAMAPETSPMDPAIFEKSYPVLCGEIYRYLLPRIDDMASNLEGCRALWEPEQIYFSESENLVESRQVKIDEFPEFDLCVVTMPSGANLHPMSIHNRSDLTRIVTFDGEIPEFRYRYESWVMFASRPIPKRVDLTPLAGMLNDMETNGAVWSADAAGNITPAFRPSSKTSIPFEVFLDHLQEHLASAPAAWDPWTDSR